MDKEQRYEVNSKGELVIGVPKVCNNRKEIIEQLFSRFGWQYELLSEKSQAHFHVKVSNSNLNKSYTFHLFHGNVRKEDPERNREEKKIQLGGLDPREFKDEMCIILGVYIYENESIDDAVIVAWPLEEEKNYPNNPSLRVNMRQDILPAKNGGIHFDRTTGKNIVAFKPDFIYYYLEHYQDFSQVVYKLETDAYSKDEEEVVARTYDFSSIKTSANNRVVYGTPGCGKSYYVQHKLLPELGIDTENDVVRTTFYQDYTNTDFVGQILPKVAIDKTVSYEFNPGPFSLALKKAIEHPDKPVALVIEELNRGNAASIFGDIFQLLDRDEDGKSEYDITNVNIQDYLNKCFADQHIVFDKIRIPANLYIIATMNTSDQNVFTLDTAFKRRWMFEKIRNTFDDTHEYKDYYVPGMDKVTWKELVEGINDFIINRPDDLSSEDKLIGVYFIEKETLCEKAEECSDAEKKKRFAYKLFEYLWDDVAKFSHQEWFGKDIKSLDQLIDNYMESGRQVLAYVLK